MADLRDATVTYGHARFKIDDYWQRGITGQGVKIMILDDPIGKHDALPISGGLACGGHETWEGSSGHGTHCAGIAAARNLKNGEPTGIAPDAEIYISRMYYRTYYDRAHSLIETLEYAIENGIDIVSMSVHIKENTYDRVQRRLEGVGGGGVGAPKHIRLALRRAFIKAYKAGVIVFVAAGNNNSGDGKDNIEVSELLPKMPNVVTVANATPIGDRRLSSGVGKWVDIIGYGSWIRATHPNNTYGIRTGTSMSTPQIAGVFALYKQLFSDLTAQEVLNKMFDNCEPLDGLNKAQQGRGVPMPSPELYDMPVIDDYPIFRRYKNYTWQAVDAFYKNGSQWKEMEAMGFE